jgi:hypothetical protein
MFPFSFVFFSLITHIRFSLLENNVHQNVAQNPSSENQVQGILACPYRKCHLARLERWMGDRVRWWGRACHPDSRPEGLRNNGFCRTGAEFSRAVDSRIGKCQRLRQPARTDDAGRRPAGWR